MAKNKLIKFLPSYVGSKAYWVPFLEKYQGEDFVEVFAGSAVLSANLAKTATINDLDPIIYKIFSNYQSLLSPEPFTEADYFRVRTRSDWWKYIYCLQKMSFSGVFRYSKNGFNVPIKKDLKQKFVNVKEELVRAQKRFKSLNATVLNLSFEEIPLEEYRGKVVVFDPPYEGSKASYNKSFDYEAYWKKVQEVSLIAKTVILFDSKKNIEKAGYEPLSTRKMRVNGARPGDEEAIAIIGDNRFQDLKSSVLA